MTTEHRPPFNKYELGVIERTLRRLTDTMRESRFIGDDDPHLAKCEALRIKVSGLKESAQ